MYVKSAPVATNASTTISLLSERKVLVWVFLDHALVSHYMANMNK